MLVRNNRRVCRPLALGLSLIFVLFGWSMPAVRSALVMPLGLENLDAFAAHVFMGRCITNTVDDDPTVGTLVTYTTFEVLRSFKGSQNVTYTIKQLGGALPSADKEVVVPGLPRFEEGKRYLLFLPEPSELGFSSPIGLTQGSFDVLQDDSGAEIVTNGRELSDLLGRFPRSRIPPRVLERIERRARGDRSLLGRSLRLDDLETMLQRLRQDR